ncbi:hypothetical protein [Mesorhizobium sp. M2C.T.Ca.TU.002.02.1.1]|jgi:hypothetical protein|uniref:hypothetical protein n=1 Tax=Mesorhizobium sp. M2C.T.Ca.TU.002.02.1.1 TaxID=2496788 RepID=UPI0013E31F9E|nr:hypothetical protein [Mesorhizobium sp. M2C.T.Ca.TU.002.02.1.1]
MASSETAPKTIFLNISISLLLFRLRAGGVLIFQVLPLTLAGDPGCSAEIHGLPRPLRPGRRRQ